MSFVDPLPHMDSEKRITKKVFHKQESWPRRGWGTRRASYLWTYFPFQLNMWVDNNAYKLLHLLRHKTTILKNVFSKSNNGKVELTSQWSSPTFNLMRRRDYEVNVSHRVHLSCFFFPFSRRVIICHFVKTVLQPRWQALRNWDASIRLSG